MKIAILGSSGFVGSRLIEQFYLGDEAEVVPIIRGYASLARTARFPLNYRVADALDFNGLVAAFEGCDVVLHSIHGTNEVLIRAPKVAYKAAAASGVKRIVYLSTTSVHGQNIAPGTDEGSPIHSRHAFSYNNAKVRAEKSFLRLRESGNVELVVLRPAQVFGPRGPWIGSVVNSILSQTAFLAADSGICNTVYVDNLVHAIRLALTASVDGEVFNIVDREVITWKELYSWLACALGSDWEVPEVSNPETSTEAIHPVERMKTVVFLSEMAPYIPTRLKFLLRDVIEMAREMKNVPQTVLARRRGDPLNRPGIAGGCLV